MLFVVTSSRLCQDDFLTRMTEIAKAKPDRIILREKHLCEKDYDELAEKCLEISRTYHVGFSVNSFVSAARKLKCDLHIPVGMLREHPELAEEFAVLGVSVHSAEEAVLAEKLGAKYVIFGHVFETDCKKGLPPRGLEWLGKVTESVGIPVLAIGGITAEKVSLVREREAKGVCVMSELMKCPYDEIGKTVHELNGGNH